jgi:hypothetical protein
MNRTESSRLRTRSLHGVAWLLLPAWLAAFAAPSVAAGADGGPGSWFRALEIALVGVYSRMGLMDVPEGNGDMDRHFDVSPRPPKSSVGFEVMHVFDSARWHLLGLEMTAADLHLQLLYDPRERHFGSRFQLQAGDAWVRVQPRGYSRTSFRLGHFLLPYGMNPVLSPRGMFLMPAEATDLGLKRDWGIEGRGPLGNLDWVAAATIGSGEGLHDPQPGSARNRTYLLSGRLGSPTYRLVQWGLSGLWGRLPELNAEDRETDASTQKWRIGADVFWKYRERTMFAAQVFGGRDERMCDCDTPGKVVFGGLGQAMWVVPGFQNLGLAAQMQVLNRDTKTEEPWLAAATLEAEYSLTDALSVRLDLVHEFRHPGHEGTGDDQVYLAFYYYGWGR